MLVAYTVHKKSEDLPELKESRETRMSKKNILVKEIYRCEPV